MVESLDPTDEVRPGWSIRSRVRRLSLCADCGREREQIELDRSR
jgi:hypothetical protein